MTDVWGYQLHEPAPQTWSNRLDEMAIRACDIAFSLVILVFCAPLMLITALVVWAQDGGSPLFGHLRIGRDGKTFRCLKFRSMVTDSAERLARLLESSPAARQEWERDHKLRNDPRITAYGAFIRKTSIDELPQLFNVLRGEMSLVGPRPIVASEVPRYGRYISSYYSVTPGITGLWQVSGRNNTTYRRRVVLDVTFARSRTFVLYMKILFATVPAVFLSRGAF
ncbi:sugar transferase [Caulobacter sp.]|uniref:sugar transferase n=1 Tax=Caulobacter sp. TaxID=78 RepID=UPI003BA8918B